MAAYPYNSPYLSNTPYGNNPVSYNMPAPQYQTSYAAPSIATQAPPIDNLIRVNGLEGAKAYQLPPNSNIALFDSNNDIMYIKTTDGAGFPSIRAFSFTPIDDAQETTTDYVQRPEFDALVEEVRGLMNAKQPVQPSTKQRQQCD